MPRVPDQRHSSWDSSGTPTSGQNRPWDQTGTSILDPRRTWDPSGAKVSDPRPTRNQSVAPIPDLRGTRGPYVVPISDPDRTYEQSGVQPSDPRRSWDLPGTTLSGSNRALDHSGHLPSNVGQGDFRVPGVGLGVSDDDVQRSRSSVVQEPNQPPTALPQRALDVERVRLEARRILSESEAFSTDWDSILREEETLCDTSNDPTNRVPGTVSSLSEDVARAQLDSPQSIGGPGVDLDTRQLLRGLIKDAFCYDAALEDDLLPSS